MIIVRIWQGLGNQLFQYAYAKALSLKKVQRVYLDISSFLQDDFRKYGLCDFQISLPEITAGKQIFQYIDSRELYQTVPDSSGGLEYGFPIRFGLESSLHFKSGLLNPTGNWYLKGWFQNEKYFAGYEDTVRRDLTLKKELKLPDDIQELLANEETVSVHFRRGDYKKFHNILDADYYSKAVREMERRVKNPVYLIFSDDITWVKQNMNLGANFYYVNEDHRLTDSEELALMSMCRHNIIANSSFSWWGAWLNPHKAKTVIAPRVWYAVSRFSKSYTLPDWIVI